MDKEIVLCRCKKPATHYAVLMFRVLPVCNKCVNELISVVLNMIPIEDNEEDSER